VPEQVKLFYFFYLKILFEKYLIVKCDEDKREVTNLEELFESDDGAHLPAARHRFNPADVSTMSPATRTYNTIKTYWWSTWRQYLGKYSSFRSRMSFQNWLWYCFINAWPQTWKTQGWILDVLVLHGRKYSITMQSGTWSKDQEKPFTLFSVISALMELRRNLRLSTVESTTCTSVM